MAGQKLDEADLLGGRFQRIMLKVHLERSIGRVGQCLIEYFGEIHTHLL
jgi:hypothetical protein